MIIEFKNDLKNKDNEILNQIQDLMDIKDITWEIKIALRQLPGHLLGIKRNLAFIEDNLGVITLKVFVHPYYLS